jgi:hypothetical protein
MVIHSQAQNLAGLVREIITEHQEDPLYPGAWIPDFKDAYAYDSKGNMIYSRGSDWNRDRQKWEIKRDTRYKYDQSGNQISNHTKEYNYYPDYLLSESEYETYFRNWDSPNYYDVAGSYYHHTNYKDRTESINKDTCDLDTIRNFSTCTYYYKYISPDYFSEYTRVYKTQMDESGNTSWHSGWRTENDNGVENERFDSTVYHYNLDQKNFPVQSDYYSKNFRNQVYSLIRQEKREQEFDTLGNLIMDISYYKYPDKDWSKNYEFLFQFDQNGRKVYALQIYFNEGLPYYKDSTLFSNEPYEGHEMRIETSYSWNNEDSVWIPNYMHGHYYSDTLSYYSYKYLWDENQGQYSVSHEEWITTVQNENGRTTTSIQQGYDLNTPYNYDFTREYGWVNRCDGNIQVSYDSLVAGQSPYDYFTNTRSTYYYYDLAECEEGEPIAEIQMFPNPTHTNLNIFTEDRLGLTDILIVDSMGKETFKGQLELNNFAMINIEGYKPGLYILQLNSENINYSSKFIIQY